MRFSSMTPKKAFEIADGRTDKKFNLKKQDFKKLENIIKTDPFYSYLYAKYVIKGRWIEAEPIISQEPLYNYYYAVDIMDGKLPEDMHNFMVALGLTRASGKKRWVGFSPLRRQRLGLPRLVGVEEYFSFLKKKNL